MKRTRTKKAILAMFTLLTSIGTTGCFQQMGGLLGIGRKTAAASQSPVSFQPVTGTRAAPEAGTSAPSSKVQETEATPKGETGGDLADFLKTKVQGEPREQESSICLAPGCAPVAGGTVG